MYGYILVFIQFFSIFLLFLSGPLTPNNIISLLFLVIGILLGTYALWAMRKSALRVSPGVASKATLITTGPYAFIRHPMYTAVLIVGISMLLNDFSVWRLLMYAVLLANQLFKLHYEETLLKERFEKYTKYQANTKKLIPYIY